MKTLFKWKDESGKRKVAQMRQLLFPLSTLLFTLILAACGGDYTPKPSAYLRIDVPEHSYWLVDTLPMSIEGHTLPGITLPFIFEADTSVELTLKKPRQVCTFNADGSVKPQRVSFDEVWLDIKYPQWDGVVFLTYKRLVGPADLRGQIDTSMRFLEKHYQFASGIEEQHYEDPVRHVYGTTYRLGGNRVASTYQFWVSDSSRHFLRGALYLNQTPNNDSLAPVLDFIQTDLDHLIETLRWR